MKYVIYTRVSTKGQGESGLGLEAQQRDIDLYFTHYAEGGYEVIGKFSDVLSGKASVSRPEFEKAIELAKKQKARLLVAKLDRVGRDVEVIAGLIKRVELKVACMPSADKFQLHLYAALAEQEREFISQRTKAALAAAKERGVSLGGLRDKTGARNIAAAEKAQNLAEKLRGVVAPLHFAGKTIREIATALNDTGLKTVRGHEYGPSQVSRLIKRLSL
ncbi:MAG: resolvase family protein [Osedax symbiont Rs2]|nr:MAG: resolvase family protein [Osedax symbiont Rs2]